jgi:ribonuclease P protein component
MTRAWGPGGTRWPVPGQHELDQEPLNRHTAGLPSRLSDRFWAAPGVARRLPAGVPATVGRRMVAPPGPAPQGNVAPKPAYPQGVYRDLAARPRCALRAPPARETPFDTPEGTFHNRAALTCPSPPCGRRVHVPSGGETTETPGAGRLRITTPDEADLSAEEAPSRQGARLPRPDEDDRGSPGSCRAPRPGPEAADGLTPTSGRDNRRLAMLTRPADFTALQASRTTRSHPLMTARFRRTDLDQVRFGFATGRAVGGAVIRNRTRRRLREALRVMAPSFQPGWDVLIIARPALVAADHRTLVEVLERLLRRGGVLGGSTPS